MRYPLVYGGLAGGIAIGIICATIALEMGSHATSVLAGYLIMLAALSLIFVGMKRYRDLECGGVIRFGRAFVLGLGMSAAAGLVYVVGWEIFEATTSADYIGDYAAATLANMRAEGATPAAIAAAEAEMRELAIMYRNPLWRMPMVFAEIFPVALLVSLVSAALLRNPRLLPARAAA